MKDIDFSKAERRAVSCYLPNCCFSDYYAKLASMIFLKDIKDVTPNERSEMKRSLLIQSYYNPKAVPSEFMKWFNRQKGGVNGR